MSFSSHPIKGTYYLHDLSLLMLTSITWLKWRLLAFSTVKLLLSFTPPFLYWLLWKEVTVQSLYFRGKELCSTSSRVKHLYCYLEFFCMENFVSSPSLVMESFIYISYGSWKLILYLGYSSKLLYSISQAILSLASGMLSVGSCVYVCCTFSLPG